MSSPRSTPRWTTLTRARALLESSSKTIHSTPIWPETAAKANSILAKVNSITDESLFTNLAQSAAKANSILTKVNAALDDINQGKGTIGKLLKDGSLYNELTAILADVKSGLNEVRQGEGTLGKLVKNNEAYAEAMQSLQDVRRMVASVKQNADAIKALPVVRSYVWTFRRNSSAPIASGFANGLRKATCSNRAGPC